MKKYNTLGELLIDYRNIHSISQSDFASSMDVDIRTVQRWEKNITLLKSEKEADLVNDSFLPYQLIRNLNATNPIPTYYDFRIRKYSLSEITNDLPDISWLKNKIDINSEQLHSISINDDLPRIIRYINSQYDKHNIINKQVLKQAISLSPSLNLHLSDNLGFYAGHSIFLSITEEAYTKLKNKEITNSQIKVNDLINYKTTKNAIFYAYSITADYNNNIFFIIGALINFFKNLDVKDYLYCSFTNRHDAAILNERLGLDLIWEQDGKDSKMFIKNTNRFYEGNFHNLLEN